MENFIIYYEQNKDKLKDNEKIHKLIKDLNTDQTDDEFVNMVNGIL